MWSTQVTLFAVVCWSHACWSKLVFTAIMCAFSPLAPRIHPLPLLVFREFRSTILSARCKLGMLERVSWTEPRCLKSALCPSALHHLARRPGKARSGLDLFLYLSRKPSFCPILPWFCAYSSRYPVNFRTGRCCTSLLTCGTKNSIVSFECRCRL